MGHFFYDHLEVERAFESGLSQMITDFNMAICAEG